jgi:hypothetical protein
LDECIDERLRHDIRDHECQTARYAGLAGLKNGALLSAAEVAGFDVVVTVDQNIPYQQDIRDRRIAILILRASTNRLEHLKRTLPAALAALAIMKHGDIVIAATSD